MRTALYFICFYLSCLLLDQHPEMNLFSILVNAYVAVNLILDYSHKRVKL
jgi:hypothetical protein